MVALISLPALVTKANVQSGQKELIHAGSRGIGTAAIQLAKHLGAGEIETTTSTGNIEMVKALGAGLAVRFPELAASTDFSSKKDVAGAHAPLDTLLTDCQLTI